MYEEPQHTPILGTTIIIKIKKHKNSNLLPNIEPQEPIKIIKNNENTTKKKKKHLSSQDKSDLWSVFDIDSKTIQNDAIPAAIECLYQDINTRNCSLCDALLMIMEDGFPTCTNIQCGLVYTNTLDYSPEWRFYGADDKNTADPTRCGNPVNPLLMESSFGCKILCDPKSSYEMKRIRKWTEWQAMPHKEKSLYAEFQFITIMAQNAGIPKIFIDDAMSIHKDISEQKMFRGLNRDGMKAASIYISCRLNGCPRTSHEIAEIFNLDNASATHGCSLALEILNNVQRNNGLETTQLGVTLPSAFIDRYCSKLNINKDHTMLCRFIASKVERLNLIPDNTPHSIAAGIIFFVCQVFSMAQSKGDIAAICKVSEVTISKCYRKLDSIKFSLVPPSLISKIQPK